MSTPSVAPVTPAAAPPAPPVDTSPRPSHIPRPAPAAAPEKAVATAAPPDPKAGVPAPKAEEGTDLYGAKPEEKKDATKDEKPPEPDPKAKEGDKPTPADGQAAEPTFTLPEGVELDKELLTAAVPVFKELGIPAEGQQKLVDLVVQAQDKWGKDLASSQDAAWKKADKAWTDQVKADREMGGLNLKETTEALQRAAAFAGGAGAKAIAVFRESGMHNHPDIVRFLRAVGMSLAEDSITRPAPPAAKPPTDRSEKLKSLYKNSQE